jgi:hypothetical protein
VGWAGYPPFSSISKISCPSIDIKRVVVLENRRTEEYNERSLKHLSLVFYGIFKKFGIWYPQEIRVQRVKESRLMGFSAEHKLYMFCT